MRKKYGYACVDKRLFCKWNRWTEGMFPQTGTLSVERLGLCRDMMELKSKSFKPDLFDKWEEEARKRQLRDGEGKTKQSR